MKIVFKVVLGILGVLALTSCAHTSNSGAAKKSKSAAITKDDSAFKNPFYNEDEDGQKKIIERLEKQKTELELQNALLVKALNERKKVVHKLPKGEVVQQFPEFEELIFDQAKTAYSEKDEERLQEAVRIMRANQPSSQKLEVMFFWLAKLQEGKNLNSQALVTYDEFIKMFPESRYIPQAMFLKGKLYEKLNLKPQALKIYSDIRRLHPDSRERHFADAKMRTGADAKMRTGADAKVKSSADGKNKAQEVKRK